MQYAYRALQSSFCRILGRTYRAVEKSLPCVQQIVPNLKIVPNFDFSRASCSGIEDGWVVSARERPQSQ